MDLGINTAKPLIMHIDLNSCFATIEQQANPFLRGKPIAVAIYDSPNGCILAPSIEAKTYGIKTGMRIRDARILYSNLIIRTPDPPKYRDVHKKFKRIFESYSPNVYPKSIDEAIIDFHGTEGINPDLIFAAKEIKKRIKIEIGEWIRCSIGISTNRILAKLAAGIHKPDGLDVIDHTNIFETYKKVELMDFCGINVRYKARLNVNGIFTPMDFFKASEQNLKKQIFRSVVGRYWYARLRGWEVDDVTFKVKTIGHQYSLKNPTSNEHEISKLLMKLCEKTGRRLRRQGLTARGIHIALFHKDRTYWHKGRLFKTDIFTTNEIYRCAQIVLGGRPAGKVISKLSINCYDLNKNHVEQIGLWDEVKIKEREASKAMDIINDGYGEFTITPAIMMGTKNEAKDAISFGNVRGI